MVIYIHAKATFSVHHTPTLPRCVHKSVLYICISMELFSRERLGVMCDGWEAPWMMFPGSPVFSLQILSPMTEGLFHRAIMESGVAIIPYLKAPNYGRNDDVGILLTLLQLPLFGQERMGSGVQRPSAWLSVLTMTKGSDVGPRWPFWLHGRSGSIRHAPRCTMHYCRCACLCMAGWEWRCKQMSDSLTSYPLFFAGDIWLSFVCYVSLICFLYPT